MTEKRGGKALAREKQPLGFVWLLKPSHTLRMKWIKALLFILEPHRCADKLATPQMRVPTARLGSGEEYHNQAI